MTLNQLAVLREIMETGSLSQAARNLNRTQPAISLALRGLEDEIGIRLFERSGRRLVPVPEAQFLLGEAGAVLDRVAEIRRTLGDLRDRRAGSLHVAAMPGPSALLFPRYASRALDNKPDVTLSLVTRSSPQIIQLVASQRVDFGFADHDGQAGTRPKYEAETIMTQSLCALPAASPLAERDEIRASDLDGMPMGLLQSDHFSHKRTLTAFEAGGALINIRLQSQNFLPIFPFVEAGQCCTIVDPLSAATYQQGQQAVIFRPFSPAVSFDYAIFKPVHRPMSLVATDFAAGWMNEVRTILDDLDVPMRIGGS